MQNEEIAALRVYHETRCQQEKVRISRARCAKSAIAHAHLFSLHRMMTIDLCVPPDLTNPSENQCARQAYLATENLDKEG